MNWSPLKVPNMTDEEIDRAQREATRLIETAFSLKARADAIKTELGFSIDDFEKELSLVVPAALLVQARKQEQRHIDEANAIAMSIVEARRLGSMPAYAMGRHSQRFNKV